MKIALHGKPLTDGVSDLVKEIFQILKDSQTDIFISEAFKKHLSGSDIEASQFPEFKNLFKNEQGIDVLISIGGDGTLLNTVAFTGPSEIPILGINTGRLGFLATSTRQKVKDALRNMLDGNWKTESRMLVQAECQRQLFDGMNFGLNEFSVLKQDTSSMITVHTYLNGEFLNSYWSDGLIISTPTGSTGYSLSCGGPVVMPASHNLILTPVSPHNLNVRPLVVSDQSEITLKVETRSHYYLVSLDSRSEVIDASASITIKKAPFQARLIVSSDISFVDTLRKKLNWGYDVRN
jgi:NAD+ kinase